MRVCRRGEDVSEACLRMRTAARAQRVVQELESSKKFEDMNMRIFEAAMVSKCDEIDRDCNARLAMPPPQLADYSLALAQQVLHPDPIADF